MEKVKNIKELISKAVDMARTPAEIYTDKVYKYTKEQIIQALLPDMPDTDLRSQGMKFLDDLKAQLTPEQLAENEKKCEEFSKWLKESTRIDWRDMHKPLGAESITTNEPEEYKELTPEEADREYAEAPEVPLSKELIDDIVQKVCRPVQDKGIDERAEEFLKQFSWEGETDVERIKKNQACDRKAFIAGALSERKVQERDLQEAFYIGWNSCLTSDSQGTDGAERHRKFENFMKNYSKEIKVQKETK